MPRTRLIVVEAEFVLGGFETIFDRPPTTFDFCESLDSGSFGRPCREEGEVAVGDLAADQKPARPELPFEHRVVIAGVKIGEFEIGPVVQVIALRASACRQASPSGSRQTVGDFHRRSGDALGLIQRMKRLVGFHAEHIALAGRAGAPFRYRRRADGALDHGQGAPPTAFTPEAPPIDPNAIQNMQDRKIAFVNAPVDRRTVSPDRLAAPASRYVLQAVAVISAALITGIRSDLPGQITAQVTKNVYDSPTGRFLLIPQGAKLIGVYDSQIAFGQSRVLLAWNRLILPDGHSIVLERQLGADAAGYSGLEDGVDHHWLLLFQAATVSTILGVGTQLGSTGEENALIQALCRGGAQSLNQTGQQIVGRNLNIQPTLTIRPGFPVRVIATRDLVLAPYGASSAIQTSGLDP